MSQALSKHKPKYIEKEYNIEGITEIKINNANKNINSFSIRGVMRYYFRRIFRFNSIKYLSKFESHIFGNTEKKSPVKIIVENNDNLNKSFIIKFISYDNQVINVYENLLILVSIVGGFGNRSRRGKGAFKITQDFNIDLKTQLHQSLRYIDDYLNCLEKNVLEFKNKKEKKYINFDNIENFKEAVKEKGNNINTINFDDLYKTSSKKVKYPTIRKLHIKKITEFSEIEINELIKKNNKKRIFNNVKSKNENFEDYIHVFGTIKPRFASPIIITFSEFNNQKYLVITELDIFLPDDIENKLKGHEKTITLFKDRFVEEVLR